jgi:CDP-glycerol glycerophosphotransferase (TagB/SpsB family)
MQPLNPARISLVVPIFNVDGYLWKTLQSIDHQTVQPFEVILVDDASTDYSRSIAQAHASDRDWCRVIALPENGGLGNARNVGLEAARGDYVIFLDSDDWLSDDAIERITDRIGEADSPDIVFYDYARVSWWGGATRNSLSTILEEQGNQVMSATDNPDLIEVFHVAWNKAYRIDFLRSYDLDFPDGIYEDIPFTYPALLLADRVAVLNRVCIFYRQRRAGNILKVPGREHFDVLQQWDRLFAFMDLHPGLDALRPALYRKMLDHFLAIFRLGEKRIPRELEREFFDEATTLLNRHSVELDRTSEAGQMRENLFKRGMFRTYKLLKAANKANRWGRSKAKSSRKWTRKFISKWRGRLKLIVYKTVLLRLPIDESLVIFGSYWGRLPSGNPKAVYEGIAASGTMRGVWLMKLSLMEEVPEDIDAVAIWSWRYFYILARAKYAVNNVNFENHMVKRTGSIHLQTQHGTPLKKMGMDLIEHPAASGATRFGPMLERSDRWDYNLSSSPYASIAWRRAFPAGYEMLEVGQPRNDVLFGDLEAKREKARAETGIAAGKKVILYAPTHKEWLNPQPLGLDPHLLATTAQDEFVLLIRSHHLVVESAVAPYDDLVESGFLIDVSDHPDVYQLCLAADLLITDYSSLMFDFALLGRPIVLIAGDIDTYSEVRGFYVDIRDNPPGQIVDDTNELAEVLSSGAYQDPSMVAAVKAFADQFCQFEDGHATERVLQAVFGITTSSRVDETVLVESRSAE